MFVEQREGDQIRGGPSRHDQVGQRPDTGQGGIERRGLPNSETQAVENDRADQDGTRGLARPWQSGRSPTDEHPADGRPHHRNGEEGLTQQLGLQVDRA